jgi:CPA1 family monovalent cation:H+ antiporter
VKLETTALVTLQLLLPFIAYIIAEQFEVSGVLAVVILGLLISQGIYKDKKLFPLEAEQQTWAFLDIGVYGVSGFIFIMMGLELPMVWEAMPKNLIPHLLVSAVLIFAVALLVRMFFILRHKVKIDQAIYMQRGRALEHRHSSLRHQQRVAESIPDPLGWREALIIGRSGMRGIVSLATALTLPLMMGDGSTPFPQRETIIFLTVVVVTIMLVVQGLGLPFLVKFLERGKKPFRKKG